MDANDLDLVLMSGAGNRFAVIDCFSTPPPGDPSSLAIEICGARDRANIASLDGLILIGPPTKSAECSMTIFNADGSRPETCGNGLRCVAKLVSDRRHVTRDAFTIETDAGVRACTVDRRHGRVATARVHMGSPRILALDEPLALQSGAVRVSILDVGNPHCVLVVEDERTALVASLGREIETHARFPRGTNVGFLACRSAGAFLRVWERGVGETRACGSGACAAAFAACALGLLDWPIPLTLPGGVLVVDTDGQGGVFLSGPVEEHGPMRWSRARATVTHAVAPSVHSPSREISKGRPGRA